MKTFLVKFTYSFQVTQDSWELSSLEKMFDETTTLKEVKEWVYTRINQPIKTETKLFEVKLSEPE